MGGRRQADRETERERVRETDRQTDRQTDREYNTNNRVGSADYGRIKARCPAGLLVFAGFSHTDLVGPTLVSWWQGALVGPTW